MLFKRTLTTILGTALAIATPGFAQTTKATAPAKSTSTKTTAKTTEAPAAAPTDQEIASAKAKGMVWVNTTTKVYHKDGEFYGKTKRGKFMTEADAQKAGFRAAQEPGAKKATSTAKSTATKATKATSTK